MYKGSIVDVMICIPNFLLECRKQKKLLYMFTSVFKM